MKAKLLVAIMLAAVAMMVFAAVAYAAVSQDTILAILDDARRRHHRRRLDERGDPALRSSSCATTRPTSSTRTTRASSRTTWRACRLQARSPASSLLPGVRSSCSSGPGPASPAVARSCVAVVRRRPPHHTLWHGAPSRAPRFVLRGQPGGPTTVSAAGAAGSRVSAPPASPGRRRVPAPRGGRSGLIGDRRRRRRRPGSGPVRDHAIPPLREHATRARPRRPRRRRRSPAGRRS